MKWTGKRLRSFGGPDRQTYVSDSEWRHQADETRRARYREEASA